MYPKIYITNKIQLKTREINNVNNILVIIDMGNHLTCYLTGNYVRTIWEKLAIEPLKSNTLFYISNQGQALFCFL